MKAVNRFFAKVGIVLLAILSIIIDLILLSVVTTIIAAAWVVAAIGLIFYGTFVLTRKALKGVR